MRFKFATDKAFDRLSSSPVADSACRKDGGKSPRLAAGK
jgi:hypothetical protein